MQTVRNDWEYPNAPHQGSTQNTALDTDAKAMVTAHVASHTTTTPLAALIRGLDFEPVGWREREYSENDTTDDDEEQLPAPIRLARKVATPTSSDESTAEKKLARKRRRQARFDEEMTWNVGLAHFSAQRNAWTAARTTIPQAGTVEKHQGPMDIDPVNVSVTSSAIQLPDETQAITEDATVRLPIPPKLLPNHPVRARITVSTYAEIYSKIILQARTPTIPINLQDIINALIHGWKAEGNWPPQAAAPEPSVVAKAKKKQQQQQQKSKDDASTSPKHPHLTKGVHVVTKVFHGLTGGPLDGTLKHR